MSANLIDLVARGLWHRDGKPFQAQLNNHSLVEGYGVGVRKPYFPPETVEEGR